MTVVVLMFGHDCLFGSSDSNSSSSDGSRPRSVQSSATHVAAQSGMTMDGDEPRRSFGIRVQNLPVRSTGQLMNIFEIKCFLDLPLWTVKENQIKKC